MSQTLGGWAEGAPPGMQHCRSAHSLNSTLKQAASPLRMINNSVLFPEPHPHTPAPLSSDSVTYRMFISDWHSLGKDSHLSAFVPLAQGFGQLFLALPKALHSP